MLIFIFVCYLGFGKVNDCRKRCVYKFFCCSNRLVRRNQQQSLRKPRRKSAEKEAKEMDRKRTVRGNHQGILFWPRLTSAFRHFGRNRDWEFNSSPHCNALTPCCSYTVIQRELKRGNAYKFKRLYGAKGENPQDHPVYLCLAAECASAGLLRPW